MSGALKKTTGLTGMAVVQNPHRDLLSLYDRIMRVLVTMPSNASYRMHTEKLIKERTEIVKQNPNVMSLEQKIGCGQAEELLIQARNELSLAKNMQMWKPWEKLIEEAPANQWAWPPHK